jgi:hypothetical protein
LKKLNPRRKAKRNNQFRGFIPLLYLFNEVKKKSMAYDERRVTLTSDGSGDASETIEVVNGELLKVSVYNSATVQPDDNWDLTIYQGVASSNNYNAHFIDTTVSQTNTAAQVYYPVKACNKSADGTDSVITETPPMADGLIVVKGANMGAATSAIVQLIFRVA